ncbi:DsrE family protein [Candidatus Albibeggiatoa sp. nov. NOAA]|uniref:DsrE family protein n=1 Tax=Candidatus Albibeggiatoa sp. nov. NOAA TaxID=3162724 RepID=UPI0032FD7D81|nr:DsrE family protein [Thiotrichaceae bacterium]
MLRSLVVSTCISLCLLFNTAYAEQPNDAASLKDIAVGKAVFDINIAGNNAQKLALYLKVIEETYDGLVAQNVQPDILLAFRGSSVQMISTNQPEDMALDTEEQLEQVAELLKGLAEKGVKFEACSVATRVFNVANDSLLPNIQAVGNTFISLIGYQAKGYAVIPIY